MASAKSISVQWLGDIALTAQFLDRAYHHLLEENREFLRSNLEPADLRIANWEAPLLGDEGLNPLKKIALHTDRETASKAVGLGLDVAIVANNHIFDSLESGYARTISFLTTSGIRAVGAGQSDGEAADPLHIDVKEVPVTILAYVGDDTHPRVPLQRSMHLNRLEPDRVIRDVRKWASEKRMVLVHLHCGMDFLSLPSPEHRRLSRRLIQEGAVVVACYHPHRLQGYERFGRGCIFYGLSNLIAGNIYPWPRFTEPTVAVTCDLSDGRLSDLRIQHLLFRKGRLELDRKGRGNRMYRTHNRKIAVPDEKRYARYWYRALAADLAVTRPVHFIRRHRNPLSMFAALEKRHFSEYGNLLKKLLRKLFASETTRKTS